MAERQEGIPVIPAERKHAEALHVRAADTVVDTSQQLYFLGAVAAEQRVVDDEDVPARLALFSVKQISPFSSSEFPIVIVGKSPLSAGLVRKQVPLLHPAA
jgi:hypothetical protein